jgi:hypothetical protein
MHSPCRPGVNQPETMQAFSGTHCHWSVANGAKLHSGAALRSLDAKPARLHGS